MARIADENTDAVVAATTFAAHGYVVIAPNYVGYADSTAAYHPYYVLEPQARDVIAALDAGVSQSHHVGVRLRGDLYLVGYSQGGAVALATQREIERGKGPSGLQLKASAASAGAFAIEDLAIEVFKGSETAGVTGFLPMVIESYQRSGYGIYSARSDVFADPVARALTAAHLPGTRSYADLLRAGTLPRQLFDRGDGSPYVVKERFRQAFLQDPAHPLRRALSDNSLRGWTPKAPLLMCHGVGDRVVPPSHSKSVAEEFKQNGAKVTLLKIDEKDPSRPALAKALMATPAEQRGLQYHFFAMPLCQAAARSFFEISRTAQ